MSITPRQKLLGPTRLHYGDSKHPDTYVENGTCESLLLSYGHYKVGTGWSGGGPFFQFTNSIVNTGWRHFPGYTDSLIERLPTDAVGVNPAPTRLFVPPLKPLAATWSNERARNWTWSAEGYRKTRPGNPIASLGQFIIELRDLPQVPFLDAGTAWRTAARYRRHPIYKLDWGRRTLASTIRAMWRKSFDSLSYGSEYLNIVFGWKPFIHDLQQVYNLWKTIDKRMAQIIRDNGKGIRKGSELSNTSSCTSEQKEYTWAGAEVRGFPAHYQGGTKGHSSYLKETKIDERVWYSARYRYYIPDVTSSQWTRKARLALFGALPTPQLIWAVIPWSWLVDWAVNVSDVMSNASMNAVENLTQDYSYIMRQLTKKTTYQCCGAWPAHTQGYYPAGSGVWTTVVTEVTKTRSSGGSPYALNAIGGTSFSPYQLGVLAALGSNLVNQT